MEEKQPWVTCYLTDMLLSYVEEALEAEGRLDYPALFRGAEGFDIPSDLKSYLSDVDNWMPLSVLRGLKGISRGSAELIEKRTIIDALAKTGGNVTHAAKELGISRATLQTK